MLFYSGVLVAGKDRFGQSPMLRFIGRFKEHDVVAMNAPASNWKAWGRPECDRSQETTVPLNHAD